MKIKEIEWKEYGETIIGTVGKFKLFSITYLNDFYNGQQSIAHWRLTTKLPFPTREFHTREQCREAGKAMLQKFVALITYE